jgi:hypothetical protein
MMLQHVQLTVKMQKMKPLLKVAKNVEVSSNAASGNKRFEKYFVNFNTNSHCFKTLKGHSHKKAVEIISLYHRFGSN